MDRRMVLAAVAAVATLTALLAASGVGTYTPPGGVNGHFTAKMTPYEVVPPVHSKALAFFDLTIRAVREGGAVRYDGWYKVSWMDLSSPPQRIYLAFAKPGQTGGIILWVCGGGGKPSCPNATWGAIDSLYIPSVPIPLRSEDIQAIPGQGIAAGDLEAFATALFQGAVYAQIETANFPNGELRGQLTK
ncbi:MAG: CHRD domain-containing protein [Nitrososphaerota archaeon]